MGANELSLSLSLSLMMSYAQGQTVNMTARLYQVQILMAMHEIYVSIKNGLSYIDTYTVVSISVLVSARVACLSPSRNDEG